MEMKRVLTVEQMRLVSELAYEYFPIYYDYVNPQHVQDYLDKYQSVSAIQAQIDQGFDYRLIFDANTVIGYLGLEIQEEDVNISKIYFHPNHTRKGFGKQTLHWIKEKAVQLHKKQIVLHVMPENKAAIRFYKNNDFVITGERHEEFESGAKEMNYVMVHPLK